MLWIYSPTNSDCKLNHKMIRINDQSRAELNKSFRDFDEPKWKSLICEIIIADISIMEIKINDWLWISRNFTKGTKKKDGENIL